MKVLFVMVSLLVFALVNMAPLEEDAIALNALDEKLPEEHFFVKRVKRDNHNNCDCRGNGCEGEDGGCVCYCGRGGTGLEQPFA